MQKGLICFDLDGLYFTEQSFQKFKENLAPNIEKSKRDYVLALSDQMTLFKTGKMTEEDYRSWAKNELGLSSSLEEIYEKLSQAYEINEEVKALAHTLRDRGYTIGICSNNFPTRIRELEKKFHFLEDFDVRVFSYETGIMKPDPKIFQVLIEKSGLDPKQIFYSDDKEEKIEGAKTLGIHTFIFHNFQEFVQDLKKCGIEI